MDEFILLIQGDGEYNFSEEEMEIRKQRYITWMNQILDKGQYVWGQPLKAEGIHLKDTDTLLTDGPFLEPKEMIGGIVIFKASNLEEAKQWALSCPLLDEFQIYLRPASMEM